MPSKQIDYLYLEKGQLSDNDHMLLQRAEAVLRFSHSPYSNFKVASAVLLEDGSISEGTNQENAAYPSGLCAERVALYAAKGRSHEKIKTLLVIARDALGQPADAFCCGGCRQVIMEYASLQDEPIRIVMGDHAHQFVVLANAKDLLPFHFNSSSLQ
ncbi:MAG: cytidine deaminase [Cyclobacteriaceae bacterium]|nr:cytidine deaminase [Cyclobacteriaceae bacterium]